MEQRSFSPIEWPSKCSRKIILKFRAKISEKLSDLGINGFLRPSDETPSVILSMLPDDFDQVQLGTVCRRIEEHHAMFDEPAVDRFLIDVVMNRGVVEHHHRHQTGLSFLRDVIKELKFLLYERPHLRQSFERLIRQNRLQFYMRPCCSRYAAGPDEIR